MKNRGLLSLMVIFIFNSLQQKMLNGLIFFPCYQLFAVGTLKIGENQASGSFTPYTSDPFYQSSLSSYLQQPMSLTYQPPISSYSMSPFYPFFNQFLYYFYEPDFSSFYSQQTPNYGNKYFIYPSFELHLLPI